MDAVQDRERSGFSAPNSKGSGKLDMDFETVDDELHVGMRHTESECIDWGSVMRRKSTVGMAPVVIRDRCMGFRELNALARGTSKSYVRSFECGDVASKPFIYARDI